MSTVEKIVQASIKLFNEEGISQISLRGIAEEVGISHGNLTYHFSNKGEILDNIYSRMQQEMDDVVYPLGNLTLRHYHQFLKAISEFHDKYQFFYFDILDVARMFPHVMRRYRKTVALRFEQYDSLMKDLVTKGLVKREPQPGYYRSQFRAIWAMSTFWLQLKRVLGDSHPVVASGSDIRHVWEIMLPHLTAKGLREFKEICESERGRNDHYPATQLISKMYLAKVG